MTTPKTPKTPYDILGVDTSATQEQVKKAWRSLVKTNHPDAGGRADGFSAIQRAYELLSDPKRRKVYDDLNGIVKQVKPDQDDVLFQNPSPFVSYNMNSGSVYAVYSQQWTAQRVIIAIPRGQTLSVQYSQRPLYQLGSLPPIVSAVIIIEAQILMRGLPLFGPNDVLRLEYNNQGQVGVVDVKVDRVLYEPHGNDTVAVVNGTKI